MRRKIIWAFVLSVAAFDLLIAWMFHAIFQEVELNPFAKVIHMQWGITGLVFLKSSVLMFIWIMSTTKARISNAILPILLFAHIVLFVILLCSLFLYFL